MVLESAVTSSRATVERMELRAKIASAMLDRLAMPHRAATRPRAASRSKVMASA
jgi:hypothetical protein